ncbi:hypothetical protein [Marinifilum caeruleilacunae]|nr:hypothetical protein [Marinifilum caeruleilacunae]
MAKSMGDEKRINIDQLIEGLMIPINRKEKNNNTINKERIMKR